MLLDMVLQAAEQKRCSQHKQRIGDDRPGDRGLDERVLTGMQRCDCDNQLGQISQCCVEQPADCIAGLFSDGFGCVTEQGGEGHDRQHSKHEQQRVRSRRHLFDDQNDRYERQHPQQRVLADLLEQSAHTSSFGRHLH